MNTSSINEILEIKFGYKDNYTIDELNQIDRLVINRFDISGELLNVDFSDLRYLNNLEELTIKQCILDNDIINVIVESCNLKKLVLFYCDIIGNIEESFKKLNIEYLVINDTNLDLNLLRFLNLKKIVLANININSNVSFVTDVLDIQRCLFDNIKYFKMENIDKLKLSYSQYISNKEYLNLYKDKLIIMEDNGEFVYKFVEV